MGFFDRFSKTFLGKKDSETSSSGQTGSYSTLSLFTTEVNAAPAGSTEFEKSAGNGGVAVAEMPEFGDASPINSGNDRAAATIDYFDADFDHDLDAVFASLENQSAEQADGLEAETEVAEEMTSDDQVIVEQLFADIAANYARPIKNFMFELKRGTATKDWIEICRPAMQGITRAAEGMGLRQAAQRMMDFEAALSLAQQNEQRVLAGEVRDL
ncbi:MAG TPA: hypothetical protein VLA93_19975, partial [Pyrinomonadaceae bacterium]|nr:hypothetical protein [Pyrinomonadaceae bacterium]